MPNQNPAKKKAASQQAKPQQDGSMWKDLISSVASAVANMAPSMGQIAPMLSNTRAVPQEYAESNYLPAYYSEGFNMNLPPMQRYDTFPPPGSQVPPMIDYFGAQLIERPSLGAPVYLTPKPSHRYNYYDTEQGLAALRAGKYDEWKNRPKGFFEGFPEIPR
jgi:hypothetical protein